jgi:hypothetical protein
MLKPQDVAIALESHLIGPDRWTMKEVAQRLELSYANVHEGVQRLRRASLMAPGKDEKLSVVVSHLFEFLVHGAKYSFAADIGAPTRGMLTSYAAPPLANHIVSGGDLPPVWPYAEGTARGYALSPLYPKVPLAAASDPRLYELLALVDALRSGRAREVKLAEKELAIRLGVEA